MGLDIALINPVLRTPYVLPPFVVGRAHSIPASELPDVNIVELGQALGDLGHHVTIFAADAFLESSEVEVSSHVTVCAVPTHLRRVFNPALIAFTPALEDSPRLREADVIQSGDFHQLSTFFASRLAPAAGIPFLVWQEGYHRMRVPGQWYERFYESTAGRSVRTATRSFILRTKRARAYLESLGIPASQIGPWIPTGIDGRSFHPGPGTLRPEDVGLPKGCSIATTVARLDPDKGVDLAIRACGLLAHQGVEVGLLVRGSGPEQERLEALARQLGIDERVRFLGRMSRTQMAELYTSSDVVVLASRRDLFPFALLEAAACGRPVVSTRVGCIDELVEDGVNGVLTAPDTAEALATGIRRLLSDDGLQERMGRALAERFAEDFDLRVTATRLAAIYQEAQAGEPTLAHGGGNRAP